ncbi:MAG: AsmA family protein [bacterium]|nr:AsmA family protein [bacterium]
MNNLLQILLSLFIAALVTALAAPYFIDWNQYKSEIEAQASKLIGHNLTVAGDIHLRLLPAPYLQLENISIDAALDPANSDEPIPSLLEAQAFRLWLSAPPLLRGAVEVQEIVIIKPHLRFAMDASGNSNWARKPVSPPSLPFTPTAISLQSMTIVNGTVEVSTKTRGNGVEKKRGRIIHALNGGFSADSLKGPFKFDGTIGKGDTQQVLRVSTGSINDKEQMRVRGILRSPNKGHRYAFDGSILQLSSQPTLNGVISGSFPFFRASQNQAKMAGGKNRVRPIEVKTSIDANTDRALFDKILVTIVHKNRPQVLTGKGRLSWGKGHIDINGNLSARLIDIDHLKDGMQVGNSLKEVVTNLFASVQTQANAANLDSGQFHVNINQIKLNGDLVQDLQITLQQTGKQLQIKKFNASLPGNNAVVIAGRFEEHASSSLFKGNGLIRGQSLGHLVTWMAGTKLDGGISAIRSHPFTMRGNVLFGSNIWAVNSVRGDIAGTSFTGKISHRAPRFTPVKTQRGEIDLKLTTSEINSTALVGRPVAMRELIDSLLKPSKARQPDEQIETNSTLESNSGLGVLAKDNNLRLQLRAGRLRLDDFDGRDLVADLYFGDERLQITQLSLRSQKGLRVEADGSINKLDKTPGGTLTATINIEEQEELQQFSSWFVPENSDFLTNKQSASLLPLRIAIMLQANSDTGDRANIRVNGIAGTSHISLDNRVLGTDLFSSDAQRKINQLELSGTITNNDGRVLLTQIVPYLPVDPTRLEEIGKAHIWFSSAGSPRNGLKSRIEFGSSRVTGGFDGLLGWYQDRWSFTGKTRLQAKDMTSGLALIGIDSRDQKSSGALDLAATLHKKDLSYKFSQIQGTVASSEIEGSATLELGAKEKKLDLIFLTSALHIPALFSPMLEHPLAKDIRDDQSTLEAARQLTKNVQREVETLKPLMTNRRFNADLLRGINTKILVTADTLTIGDKIKLRNGDLSATIKDRKITLDNLGGKLWGGQLNAAGELDLSTTLATMRGRLAIQKASIEQLPLSVDNSPIATGTMSLKLDLNGRGFGPAGLFSLMNGKGRIDFTRAKLNHFSSTTLNDIVDDELAVWKQSEDQSPFKERFIRHLLHADFDIPSLTADIIISDGTANLKTTHTSQNQAKLDLDASLVLASMTTHSRLTISPMEQAKYANLPAASVLYEGSLNELDAITPNIDTASLEQHLKVMKMEHDVNLLEKLHKRDEEFARKAAEHRAMAKQRREKEKAEKEKAEKEKLKALEEGETPIDENVPPTHKRPPNWSPFGESLENSN